MSVKTDGLGNTLIHLTDSRGERLPDVEEWSEPEKGSILMVGGEHGTAWQRRFDDGRWHSCRGGTPRSWSQLTRRRQVVLVYDAEARS